MVSIGQTREVDATQHRKSKFSMRFSPNVVTGLDFHRYTVIGRTNKPDKVRPSVEPTLGFGFGTAALYRLNDLISIGFNAELMTFLESTSLFGIGIGYPITEFSLIGNYQISERTQLSFGPGLSGGQSGSARTFIGTDLNILKKNQGIFERVKLKRYFHLGISYHLPIEDRLDRNNYDLILIKLGRTWMF